MICPTLPRARPAGPPIEEKSARERVADRGRGWVYGNLMSSADIMDEVVGVKESSPWAKLVTTNGTTTDKEEEYFPVTNERHTIGRKPGRDIHLTHSS